MGERGAEERACRFERQQREEGEKKGRTVYAEEAGGRGNVLVYAAGAVELDGLDASEVAPAAGDELVRGAVHARADAKVTCVVLGVLFRDLAQSERRRGWTYHLLKTLTRDDVALVNEAVEKLCAGFDNRDIWNAVRLLICVFQDGQLLALRSSTPGRRQRTSFDVQDHLHRLLVERHQVVQARQVEVVLDKVLLLKL